MATSSIATEKYWERIVEYNKELPINEINIFAIFIYLNNGDMAWLSNCKEAAIEYAELGLSRSDILHQSSFRKNNRVIYTDEYDNNDKLQQELMNLMTQHGFSRIYCLSRFCPDCSLLLAANTQQAVAPSPKQIYKETKNHFEDFCITFIDGMLDVYLEELPALAHSRFATDARYRKDIIKNPHNEPKEPLNDKELQILYWAGQGKTADETGLILEFSKQTVDTYRKNLTSKLNASNLTHAVSLARIYGLIS